MLSSRLKNKHHQDNTARWRSLQAKNSANGKRIIHSRRHALVRLCAMICVCCWLSWLCLVFYLQGSRSRTGSLPMTETDEEVYLNIESRNIPTQDFGTFEAGEKTFSDTDEDMVSPMERTGSFRSRSDFTMDGDDEEAVTSDDSVVDLQEKGVESPTWVGVHQNIDLEDVSMSSASVPKVCGGRLFFAESLSSLASVPQVFLSQGSEVGRVLTKRSVDDCCTFCSLTSGCTAFRFDHWHCALLTVSAVEATSTEVTSPDEIAEKDSDSGSSHLFVAEEETETDTETKKEESLFESEKLEPELSSASSNEIATEDLSQSLPDEISRESDTLDLVDEDEDGFKLEINNAEDTKKDDSKTFGSGETSLDDIKSQEDNGLELFDNENAPLSLDRSPEDGISLEDSSDGVSQSDISLEDSEIADISGEASEGDDITINDGERTMTEEKTENLDIGEMTQSEEVLSRESGGFESQSNQDEVSLLPALDLPPELAEQTNSDNQNAVLDEFLGDLSNLGTEDSPFKSSIVFNADGSTSFNNGADEIDDLRPAKKTKEELEQEYFLEKLQSQDSDTKLAEKPLTDILAPGDYRRHIKDPFYDAKFKFFYRFRSSKEVTDMQTDIANHYRKRKAIAIKYMSLGKTGDKKNPKTVKVLQFGKPGTGRNVILVSALRGCEWVSPLATTHTALALMGRGTTTVELLNKVRFHVISIANPEGFDFSRRKSPASARHWCKNRRVIHGAHGVDLSRNWGLDGVTWGFAKRGKDGQNHMGFQGHQNFSEPETRIIKRYIEHFSTGRGRVALLDVKCCGARIKPPQLYRKEHDEVINVDWAASFLSKHVTLESSMYTAVKRDPTFHKANTGQMIDWAHTEANVDHAYVVDLKSQSLTTRANHALIDKDPFLMLSADLERATVLAAQLLLAMPLNKSTPVNTNFPGRDLTLNSQTASSAATQKGSGADHKKKKKRK